MADDAEIERAATEAALEVLVLLVDDPLKRVLWAGRVARAVIPAVLAAQRPATPAGELREAVDALLNGYDHAVTVHAEVVMDTPEQRDLHDEAMTALRSLGDAARARFATLLDAAPVGGEEHREDDPRGTDRRADQRIAGSDVTGGVRSAVHGEVEGLRDGQGAEGSRRGGGTGQPGRVQDSDEKGRPDDLTPAAPVAVDEATVARVLGEHRIDLPLADDDGEVRCRCGTWIGPRRAPLQPSQASLVAHQADVVVVALAARPETDGGAS